MRRKEICRYPDLPTIHPRGHAMVKKGAIFGLNSVIDFSRFNRTPIVTQSLPDSYPTITAGYYQDEDRGLKEVVHWTFVPHYKLTFFCFRVFSGQKVFGITK